MKKKLSLFAAVLVLVLSFGVPAFAADYHRSDTMNFTVKIGNYSDIQSVGVEVSYDGAILQFTSGSWSLSGTLLADVDPSKNTAAAAFAGGTSVGGSIMNLSFKVKGDAPFSSTEVKAAVILTTSGGSRQTTTVSLGTVSVVCSHSWSGYTQDGDKHSRTCSICHAAESAVHNFDKEKVTKEATCKEAGQKTLTCSACGATKEEVIPVSTSHKLGAGTKVDEKNHKQTCSVCGKEITSAHAWDGGKITKAASCTEAGKKLFTCTVCGATKEETIAKNGDHKYGSWSGNGDGTHSHTCSACGKQETVSCRQGTDWKCDENGHWSICPDCGGQVAAAGHVCEICGYAGEKPEHVHSWKESWDKDENGHYHGCVDCFEKKDETAHVYDNDCDPDCNICGYIRIAPHSFSENWSSDSVSHWHECSGCGLIRDKAGHEENGEKCTICGYEAVKETASESSSDAEPSGDGGNGTENSESAAKLKGVIYGAIGGLIIGAGGVFLLGKMKKKE